MRKFLALLCSSASLFSAINSNGDWQLWQHTYADGEVYKKLHYNADIELRFGDDMSKMYYIHAQMLMLYKFCPAVVLGSGYRQTAVRIGETDEWRMVYEPMANLTFSGTVRDWKFVNRNQVQFLLHDPDYHPNTIVYRCRLEAQLPWQPAGFVPFTSFEAFYTQRKGVNQLRAMAGMRKKVSDTFSCSAYYICRARIQQESWAYQNVLGLALGFTF